MQLDVHSIAEIVRKEIRSYLFLNAQPEIRDNNPAAINGQGIERTYPTVKILPDSSIMRIIVTGGSGFVGSHLVDR